MILGSFFEARKYSDCGRGEEGEGSANATRAHPDGREDTQQVGSQDGVVHAERDARALAVEAVVDL